MAARDHVVGALDEHQGSAGQLASRCARAGVWQVSSVPWTRSIGQATERQTASISSAVLSNGAAFSASITSTDVSSAQPAASSIAFVECGSEQISPKKNRA